MKHTKADRIAPTSAELGRHRLIQGQKVAILGLGETGLAAALFLKRRGFSIFVSEFQVSDALEGRAARLREEAIPFELGRHSLEKIVKSDWAVISPGIPPTAEVYQALRKKGIPILSEVEVACRFSPGEVIAVTGTSGKTTVTTLLDRIFKAHGRSSLACGNIGNPWIGEIDRLTPETQVILEISSFQLLHTFSFRPHVAILLNIGPNHLDWHPDLQDYVAAKLRLFQNQTPEDWALIRSSDREAFFSNFRFPSRVVYFGAKERENANEELLYEVTRLKGLDPAKTREVLSRFEGLEHRLEKVAEVGGVQFVNDSKCTTLEALIWALDRFPDGRVILLAGGHAKGADFRRVRERLQKKLKQAVVYGEAQELLWESWEGAAPLVRAPGLPEAFQEALKRARPGDAILLSPACASFDQFKNYQERGRLFKALVSKIKLTAVA